MAFSPSLLLWIVVAQTAPSTLEGRAQVPANLKPTAEVKAEFLKLLDRPKVPLDPKEDKPSSESSDLIARHVSFASEKKADGTIERVPALIVKAESKGTARLPVVILLHGTGGTKEGMQSWLDEFARRGFLAIAIDARYHGERAGGKKGSTAYVEAITKAWHAKRTESQEHPFYYDTCWDLWRTIDYLETRPDVDAKRIGMMGISMGGIETWLAASVDDRVAVIVPAISVQSFSWGLENDAWHGRANTIKAAHEAAAKDLGHERVDPQVCRELWDKVIPGIAGPYDGPSMIRLFAGRPLLIINGEKDLNCPVDGARIAIASARAAFQQAGTPDRLKVMIAPGVGHAITDEQHAAIVAWFDRWLEP